MRTRNNNQNQNQTQPTAQRPGEQVAATQPRQRTANNQGGRSITTLSRITAVAVAIAVIAAIFAAYGIWRASTSEAVLASETVDVIAASTDLPAGKVIEAQDLTVITYPKAALPTGASEEPETILGKTTVAPVSKNTVITSSVLTGAGSETLSAQIEAGKVATSVIVNQQTGLSGLVHQGDKVDVYSVVSGEGTVADVIARDCTVLALNASLDGYSPDYSGVTLEMTPEEASMVAPDAMSGHIVLVMKPAAVEANAQ